MPLPQLRDDFAFAESIGLDNAWVSEQSWIDEVPGMPLLEAWTTLVALARETQRIRIGAMGANVMDLVTKSEGSAGAVPHSD